jgi:hypothetical protein
VTDLRESLANATLLVDDKSITIEKLQFELDVANNRIAALMQVCMQDWGK